MTRRCAWVFALWVAAGCGSGKPSGGPGPTPPSNTPTDAGTADAGPLDRDYPQLATRAIALYEAVAEAFRVAGDDCARATARLNELATTYRDVVAANRKILREGRARELKPALAAHADRFDAAAKSIVESPTMAKCSSDPAFEQSFDDLVGAPP